MGWKGIIYYVAVFLAIIVVVIAFIFAGSERAKKEFDYLFEGWD